MLAFVVTKSEPQPCHRFKHMNITPGISEASSELSGVVISHLNRESKILVWMHKHRN